MKSLNQFVNDFNKISGSNSVMNMTENSYTDELSSEIKFDSKAVKIWFHKINESDVMSHYANNVWGERSRHITKPALNGKPVLAWGGIESSDNTGLNIVLISSDLDEYGDWYLLKNTHSGLARNRDNRPNPFAFTSDELIKEIHNVVAMHIYNTDVKPLDVKDVIAFISNAL